jgi:hypothetical protein
MGIIAFGVALVILGLVFAWGMAMYEHAAEARQRRRERRAGANQPDGPDA